MVMTEGDSHIYDDGDCDDDDANFGDDDDCNNVEYC